MARRFYVARSACRHGVTLYDVESVLEDPEWTMGMPALLDIDLGEPGRPNVIVYGGLDVRGEPLVVFVDRFEGLVFHSEPGLPKYEELF